MKESYCRLVEYKNALISAENYMSHGGDRLVTGPDEELKSSENKLSHSRINLSNMVGIIHSNDKDRMKKITYRATWGNVLIDFKDIATPFVNTEGWEEMKSVYFIFFQDGETIRERLWNICDSFSG